MILWSFILQRLNKFQVFSTGEITEIYFTSVTSIIAIPFIWNKFQDLILGQPLKSSCLVLEVYNETNIPCHFLFNIKIIYLWWSNIQLCFALLNISYLGWIISNFKQKRMKYLLNLILFILENETYLPT